MTAPLRFVLLVVGILALSASPALAQPHDDHGGGEGSDAAGSFTLRHMGFSPKPSTATQSDLAFRGNIAIAGSYDGFRIVDITNPTKPTEISRMICNGAQGDVSVYGNLVFRSIDSPQSSTACDSTNVTASTPGMFEGIQIFDITDLKNPQKVASVATDCGSHTHTVVPDPDNGRVFLYVSSYPLGGAAIGPNCQQPGGFISIVEVPVMNPAAATVSKYFLDPGTELGNYLGFMFRSCHDISVFMDIDRAAAACLTEGQLWDISDPAHPEFLWRYDNPNIRPENIDLFHSASFSWDGKLVAFGDESGGGGAARCTNPDDDQGRIWFLDTATGEFLANYKIPRAVADAPCTMHNFNFIPLRSGAKVLVSAAYTGGTTVVDVDKLIGGASEAESEIGYYQAHGGNTWSSYWYNGHIYANDILRGVDIYLLSDKARAGALKLDHLNPQTQISTIG